MFTPDTTKRLSNTRLTVPRLPLSFPAMTMMTAQDSVDALARIQAAHTARTPARRQPSYGWDSRCSVLRAGAVFASSELKQCSREPGPCRGTRRPADPCWDHTALHALLVTFPSHLEGKS